jgi:UDP-N-acetylmuramoyl-tripeptide--D-alanyl-D-alanine ligase
VTALFTADDLTHATGGVMTKPFHATGISIDSRTVSPGDLFIALATDTGDGHAHVAEALQKGAAGAMVHREDAVPDEAALLVVRNTQAALTELGAFARTRFEGAVVAVTGSVGKTTTKEMLRTALSACGPTHAAAASYNNHWGVPLTLARMPPDAAYAVVEIGMNHPGEIAPLANLAAPDVAIITSIAGAHLGHMGSLEAIADEKASILPAILQGGAAVLPADSPQLERLRHAVPHGVAIVTFGDSDLRGVRHDADGSDIHAIVCGADIKGNFCGTEIRFRLNAPGRHMVMNALATLNAAHCLGADISLCARALETFSPVAGRGARRPILGGTATLLDESYNASGASMRAALAVLRLLPATRRVAVLGDMLELGDHSAREHADLADAVSDSADLLYACGPWMKYLFNAVAAEKIGLHAPDSTALAPAVCAAVRAGDAVLVKGSLGSRMRVVVDALEKASG